MKRPRFRVATVRGYTIGHDPTSRRGGRQAEGVSATVCDTAYNWRTIRTYRSEDQVWRKGRRQGRGVADTLAAAEDHAAYLNEQEARRLHAGRVRELRAAARARG